MGAAYQRVARFLRAQAGTAWAVGAFKGLTETGGAGGVSLAPFLTQAIGSGSLSELFNAAFRIAIAIGAILAVVRIVYGGFLYMTTDTFSTKGAAKEVLKGAFQGLFLLLAVWIILNQINPQILNLNFLQGLSNLL
jgi:hypothetical protein